MTDLSTRDAALAATGTLDITNDMSDAGMEAYCEEERFDDFGITDNQPECIEAAYRAMIVLSPAIPIIDELRAQLAELHECLALAFADPHRLAHSEKAINETAAILAKHRSKS